jgi:deoxyadenosine/deoxycytidine kinase
MSQLICVEGNIGSGKSTLLDNLKEKYKNNNNIIFLKEPVDEWESIKDKNGLTMLEKFYGDQKKYSFSFQMLAYISRLTLLKDTIKNNPNAIIISERSLMTDKMVFAKMLYDSEKIEDVEYQIYLKWFDYFRLEYPINKIIYINSSPETCSTRINERARLGESEIPLSYLEDCDKYHDNMILDLIELEKIDIMELNGNINIKKNNEELEKWLQSIDEFISKK